MSHAYYSKATSAVFPTSEFARMFLLSEESAGEVLKSVPGVLFDVERRGIRFISKGSVTPDVKVGQEMASRNLSLHSCMLYFQIRCLTRTVDLADLQRVLLKGQF